ncbi:hypothetical protein EYF80_037677 [Liparis tanakae]|uniref:Uncharacterized protein n=1 Tax=Liparis tanakae TaxID=230148 RepID=A0A4Z2GF13_9TELE|nr:hypothetical protein EYF80_037677 [Liparis tanakae]
MKNGSSASPSRCSTNLNQFLPDSRRLRRGETLEVSCPSASASRPRERPLGRCHTLDSGEGDARARAARATRSGSPPSRAPAPGLDDDPFEPRPSPGAPNGESPESEDAGSSPASPARLNATIQTEGGDRREGEQTQEARRREAADS